MHWCYDVMCPTVWPWVRCCPAAGFGTYCSLLFFFFQAEDGIRDKLVTGVQTCALPILRGSMFAFFANQALIGRSTSGGGAPDFTTWQFGGSVGGPIVRDRVHYFASVDFQARAVPDPGPLISDTAVGADVARIGIRYASALRFQRILADTYALDPGTLGPVNGRVPAQDLFAKLTAQIGTGSHLEVSHHYAHADRRNFLDAGLEGINIPGFSGSRGQGYYALSSVAELDQSTAQTSRLIWSALVGGRWSNELITSYERLRDDCVPNAIVAQALVAGDELIRPTAADERTPDQPRRLRRRLV